MGILIELTIGGCLLLLCLIFNLIAQIQKDIKTQLQINLELVQRIDYFGAMIQSKNKTTFSDYHYWIENP